MGRRDKQEGFGAPSPTLSSPVLDTPSAALALNTWGWTQKQIVKTGDLGMVHAGQTRTLAERGAGCHVLWAECLSLSQFTWGPYSQGDGVRKLAFGGFSGHGGGALMNETPQSS